MTTRRPLRGLLMVTAILLAFAPLATQAAHPVPGTWTVTGPMHEARAFQTATLLPSGLVLVAGGCQGQCSGTDPEVNLASAELYHPHTGSWANTGAMHGPRTFDTATLLRDGRVLVAGGARTRNSSTSLASAETYDPRTGTWMRTGSMHEARAFQTATRLPDGRVLVAGGIACTTTRCAPVLASAELYDPRTGTWTLINSMDQARDQHTATLLPDGQVLVTGGFGVTGKPLAGAERYDARTGRWSPTGSLRRPRTLQSATLLRSGSVLVTGGWNGKAYGTTAELYNPRTGTWTETGSMHDPCSNQGGAASTLLNSGQVLVAGTLGADLNPIASAELYDPRTGTWTRTGSLPSPRAFQTTTLLADGRVLIAGGSRNGDGSVPTADAQLYRL